MAFAGLVLRGLVPLTTKSQAIGAASVGAWQTFSRNMAAGAAPSKNDIVHLLDNREDPEVDEKIRAYLKAAYKAGKAAPEKSEEIGELTQRVQRKYIAAQVVESGIQNISLPLSASSAAPLKRYVQELMALQAKAGFEDPVSEVTKAVREKSAAAETAKEVLASIRPYCSPEFHGALLDALAGVEAQQGGAPVTLDGSSAGYKAFAAAVKKVAAAHKIPVQLLLDAKKPAAEGSRTRLEYEAWLQSARVADAQVELDALRAEATALLDKHLSKSSEQIKSEQAAAMATLQRKIDANKGAPWAQQFARDLQALREYDEQVAADPVNGPKVAVA